MPRQFENNPEFSLRSGRTVWFKGGVIYGSNPPSDAEQHDIPAHIVLKYEDEQGRRCTAFVADVVNSTYSLEDAQRLVDLANSALKR